MMNVLLSIYHQQDLSTVPLQRLINETKVALSGPLLFKLVFCIKIL